MGAYNFDTSTVETREGQRSLLSKVFTYMFIFLLVTAAVAIGVSYAVTRNGGLSDRNFAIMVSITGFAQIILTVVIVFSSLKQGKASIVPMLLYAICMGVFVSSFARFLNWYTIASAFAISALAFGGMALLGAFSKNASGFGLVGFGLLFGIAMVSLFNIFMFIFLPRGVWVWQNILTSALIVIALLCITAYDVYNIKTISQTGENSDNLALFLAFNLYVDFIVIFVRILQMLVILLGNNRN